LYNERVDKLIRACKSSKLQIGIKEILIPGEPESRYEKECLESGIPIEEELWDEIIKVGAKYNIDINKL
jgi:LDH2 family malate/lactate/ureidoglycolate dehydrogenase